MPLRIASLLLGAALFSGGCFSDGSTATPTVPELSSFQPAPKADVSGLCFYVDPFIGTGGHGHTYPGVSLPFGMVQLSPDTRLKGWDGCSGYHFTDHTVFGFSHTHLSGTGVSDYGDILFMPVAGKPAERIPGTFPDSTYASKFSKANEAAHAGYYTTHLDDHNIDVQLTATQRVGLHQYTWLGEDEQWIVVDLEHRDQLIEAHVTRISENEIAGYRISKAWAKEQQVYFVARFSKPIREILWTSDPTGQHHHLARIGFDKTKDPVLVKVAISPVDIEGACGNLNAELPGWDFAGTQKKAEDAWNKELGKIIVKGGTPDQQIMFYTALYHSFLSPNLFSDVDGRYRGTDLKIHRSEDPKYTVFSLWDTYRATHPLFTITQQDKTNAFIRTFLTQYEQGGKLPMWELAGNYTGCMIGYHSIPVIVDAYTKGLNDFDAEALFEAMKKSAMQNNLGLDGYKKYGFVLAENEAESVSKTLEYAYDDWCIAIMAKALGKKEDYDHFIRRAQHYKNVFDPKTGFMRAKMDGSWFTPFDPTEVNYHYTEANAWQYSFYVPHDVPGLQQLYAQNEELDLEKHLDDLFSTAGSDQQLVDFTGLIGQYAHGNEPSHHIAYLYNRAMKPEKTQDMVTRIMNTMYHNAPNGLSGNEDCGQLSSWYVLSAMGFYPVCPGDPKYDIGKPLFDEVWIHLENGTTCHLKTKGDLYRKGTYIKAIRQHGETKAPFRISHHDLLSGAPVVYETGTLAELREMVAHATPDLGSTVPKNTFTPVPYFMAESNTFTDSLTVEIGNLSGSTAYYTLLPANDTPSGSQKAVRYEQPLVLTQTTLLQIYAVDANGLQSATVSQTYHQVDGSRSLVLKSKYAEQYAAGGADALIDYQRGSNNYRTGRWQGYQGQDFEAVVDLGEVKSVRHVRIGFLQNIKSWIFFPRKVAFAVSSDGENWVSTPGEKAHTPDTEYGAFTQNFTSEVQKEARYIRIKAPYYGPCPDWHPGVGGATWLFADEIVIDAK